MSTQENITHKLYPQFDWPQTEPTWHRFLALRLAQAAAEQIIKDPESCEIKIRENFHRLLKQHKDTSAAKWIERWRPLIDSPMSDLAAFIVEDSEFAHEMRANPIFIGLISSQQRDQILQQARKDWRKLSLKTQDTEELGG